MIFVFLEIITEKTIAQVICISENISERFSKSFVNLIQRKIKLNFERLFFFDDVILHHKNNYLFNLFF